MRRRRAPAPATAPPAKRLAVVPPLPSAPAKRKRRRAEEMLNVTSSRQLERYHRVRALGSSTRATPAARATAVTAMLAGLVPPAVVSHSPAVAGALARRRAEGLPEPSRLMETVPSEVTRPNARGANHWRSSRRKLDPHLTHDWMVSVHAVERAYNHVRRLRGQPLIPTITADMDPAAADTRRHLLFGAPSQPRGSCRGRAAHPRMVMTRAAPESMGSPRLLGNINGRVGVVKTKTSAHGRV